MAVQMESYDRTALRRCAGSGSTTILGTPLFHFLKNERSLLRGRFSGRCYVSSSGPNPNQRVRIRLSSASDATNRSIMYSYPSESSSFASRAGRWVGRGDLQGGSPWSRKRLVKPLFYSAVVAENGQSALRCRRQDYV